VRKVCVSAERDPAPHQATPLRAPELFPHFFGASARRERLPIKPIEASHDPSVATRASDDCPGEHTWLAFIYAGSWTDARQTGAGGIGAVSVGVAEWSALAVLFGPPIVWSSHGAFCDDREVSISIYSLQSNERLARPG
jgi:hypothetical protein